MAEGVEATCARLAAAVGGRVRRDEPLARHTSFRIGGPADVLVEPGSPGELAGVARITAEAGLPLTVLGAGSNLLVADGGIRGVVVKLGAGFRRAAWTERGVTAGAAMQIGKLARAAVTRGLSGLEFAEGIPGTVGGALFMNAGAYGGEVGAKVAAVEGVTADGRLETLAGETLAFCYRRAGLPPGFLVTAVTFRLEPAAPELIARRLAELREHRLASQPQGTANAGSIFKNPPGATAGRLIEAAGLKGRRVGGARISERHANVIVNDGGARASDVQALMAEAQRAVWERNGVWLEPEIRLVGSW
ncbi:MAG TPA: UDP-N-acetylmuramate dehydrogenase [Candidatus Limnocylindria bacterium]|nr:UDP-N-acetylmuramate dehydrogenase [Candidatus Limnocylindria bacterium]